YYSGAWGRSYELESESAADAILAAVLNPIDFPRVIESAYAQGVRTFVEIGPGASCCRMIDAVLCDRPHLASSLGTRTADAVESLYALLGKLFVRGWDLNLDEVYPCDAERVATAGKMVQVPGHSASGTTELAYISNWIAPRTPISDPTEYLIASQPV